MKHKLCNKLLLVILLIIAFWLVWSFSNRNQCETSFDFLPFKKTKYILVWNPLQWDPMYRFGPGQAGFLKNNCPIADCYFTSDRNLLNGDVTKFDAVLFNGRMVYNKDKSHLPQVRSPHQKYIFYEMESSDNFPLCDEVFDEFFNWTYTYKLDSDILCTYFLIRDSYGKIVGPQINMTWITPMSELEETYALTQKRRAVAWFVSHCDVRSDRNQQVELLQKALKSFNLQVDVFGKCGTLECPRNMSKECDRKLEEYYFYLSYENSFAEDYVTEKVLTALNHASIPIVYGGANYSRFLPPGSYLEAKAMSPDELAKRINELMKAPKLYRTFFRWWHHYTYFDPSDRKNVCDLCAALNNETMLNTYSSYKNFRSWWNPEYTSRC